MIVVPPYLRAILSTRLTRWTRWEPLESKIRCKPATFVHEIRLRFFRDRYAKISRGKKLVKNY